MQPHGSRSFARMGHGLGAASGELLCSKDSQSSGKLERGWVIDWLGLGEKIRKVIVKKWNCREISKVQLEKESKCYQEILGKKR